ncbi:MAG: cytochrome c3 family protein [Anaerolineaceae bacterium]|nr:cytochrome c3 family protein [Anaerolineaceae bacterium]
MPPIFPPRSNTIARASFIVIPLLLALVTGLVVWWLHSPAFNQVGVTIPQPVPFPHSFHISVLGLNCRYCHDSVDKSSFADLPPTQTCMSCHSQVATGSAKLAPVRNSWETGVPIQWNRVNNVPDYVYFDHHIHVNKGIGCENCHGRMDQVTTAKKAETFYMAWCLECHRNPEKFIRPKDKVYDMGYKPAEAQSVLGPKLVKEYNVMPASQLMNCSICHR